MLNLYITCEQNARREISITGRSTADGVWWSSSVAVITDNSVRSTQWWNTDKLSKQRGTKELADEKLQEHQNLTQLFYNLLKNQL